MLNARNSNNIREREVKKRKKEKERRKKKKNDRNRHGNENSGKQQAVLGGEEVTDLRIVGKLCLRLVKYVPSLRRLTWLIGFPLELNNNWIMEYWECARERQRERERETEREITRVTKFTHAQAVLVKQFCAMHIYTRVWPFQCLSFLFLFSFFLFLVFRSSSELPA